MNKKQYSLMLVLALVAGLLGGVVASQFLMGQPVYAEKLYQPKFLSDEKMKAAKEHPEKIIQHKILVAEEFRLVDRFGTLRAELKIDEYIKTPVLYMYDRRGRLIAEMETVDPDPH